FPHPSLRHPPSLSILSLACPGAFALPQSETGSGPHQHWILRIGGSARLVRLRLHPFILPLSSIIIISISISIVVVVCHPSLLVNLRLLRLSFSPTCGCPITLPPSSPTPRSRNPPKLNREKGNKIYTYKKETERKHEGIARSSSIISA
ncbi:uncharacterized protein BO80DRAFT_405618, partial [Aspergillus ibericus CBS 121593]